MENIIFYTLIIIITAGFLADRLIEYLNLRYRTRPLPDTAKNILNEEQNSKSFDYHSAKYRFDFTTAGTGLLLILSVLFLDGFARLDEFIQTITSDEIIVVLLFFTIIGLVYDFFGTPFALYDTFVIEQKFGFNRTTFTTFITDKIKGYFLSALIGVPLLAVFTWFYFYAGQFFWVYIWVVYTLFGLIMMMFYTTLILPLFNKLTTLEDGELKNAIISYCTKTGFSVKNIFIMDGSKRSSKANAFFSGLGPRKTIILFDTLIKEHTVAEIVSVLAHEVGHYRKKHTRKMMIISGIQSFLILYILSLFLNVEYFSQALGVSEAKFHTGLIAFGIIFSPFSTIIGIAMNFLSRRFEFEADRYAKETSSGTDLSSALVKLSVNQLSNINPHPFYVFVHYSHPPLLKRIERLSHENPELNPSLHS
ncbi:MAG: M48 family metallopeptidase [Bacteroidetes bacterium]|nr:M48 family metallopeptidase [Bacteroidota bacterium]